MNIILFLNFVDILCDIARNITQNVLISIYVRCKTAVTNHLLLPKTTIAINAEWWRTFRYNDRSTTMV